MNRERNWWNHWSVNNSINERYKKVKKRKVMYTKTRRERGTERGGEREEWDVIGMNGWVVSAFASKSIRSSICKGWKNCKVWKFNSLLFHSMTILHSNKLFSSFPHLFCKFHQTLLLRWYKMLSLILINLSIN